MSNFLEEIKKTGISLERLDDFRNQLQNVETSVLASGYIDVKNYESKVKAIAEVVRDELLYGQEGSKAKGEYLGRFFEGDVEEDDKGHRYIIGADGRVLKAEKRVTIKLDPEAAEAYLREKGLWEQATVKKVVGVGTKVIDKLNALIEKAEAGKRIRPEDLKDVLDELVIEEELSEERLQALVALEMLDAEDDEQLHKVTTVYALKEDKKKKK